MYNKDFFINIITILLLALAQVFIFNHINFLGSYQPYIYVVFVLFYPPYQSRYLLLLLAFILGLSIDILEYTGGIH
ncbi:MAG: rod shape-determining protein MreD, partial [Weeksellaceae bacterium]|nr:rod shape-determining protein MreD [Weeksellaceae bacterium]